MQRLLIIIGIALIILGLFYPLIQKLGIGRLPGDIFIEKGNFKLYFPITSSILISIIISCILWFINKLR